MTSAEERSEIEDPRFRIVFEPRGGYLYVYVEAFVVNFEAMRQYCSEIGARASKFPGRRVLVEKAAAEQLSTVDAFRLASELPDLGFARVKMAFVDHGGDNTELNEFTEMVGNNRGLMARTFADVDSAERWLVEA